MYNRILCNVALMALLCAGASSAADEAADRAAAQNHFEVGLSLLKSEDFSGALVEFEASIALYPTKGALYNLANCFRALHRYEKALASFEQLLREYTDTLDAEMREDAEQQAAELRKLIAELTIQVDKDGAAVFLNGQQIGKSPLKEPLVLGPGEYRIGVVLDGYERAERRITLTSGDTRTEPFELKPIETAAQALPAPDAVQTGPDATAAEPPRITEEPTESKRPLKIAGIVALAVGAAAAAGGAATGIVALKKDKELGDDCPDQKCTPEFQSDIDSLNTLATVTDALLFGGAAVAVAGAALWLFAARSEDAEPADAVLAPQIGPGFAGACLSLGF